MMGEPGNSARHRRIILDALEACGGNQSKAAKRLGVSRVTVWNRMKKYNIDLKKVLSVNPRRNEGV